MRSKKREKIKRRFTILANKVNNLNYKNVKDYCSVAKEFTSLLNEFNVIDLLIVRKPEDLQLYDQISNIYNSCSEKFEQENKEFCDKVENTLL